MTIFPGPFSSAPLRLCARLFIYPRSGRSRIHVVTFSLFNSFNAASYDLGNSQCKIWVQPDFPCLTRYSVRERVLPVLGARLKEQRFSRNLPTALKAETASATPPSLVSGAGTHGRRRRPGNQHTTQRTHSPDPPPAPASVPGRESPGIPYKHTSCPRTIPPTTVAAPAAAVADAAVPLVPVAPAAAPAAPAMTIIVPSSPPRRRASSRSSSP